MRGEDDRTLSPDGFGPLPGDRRSEEPSDPHTPQPESRESAMRLAWLERGRRDVDELQLPPPAGVEVGEATLMPSLLEARVRKLSELEASISQLHEEMRSAEAVDPPPTSLSVPPTGAAAAASSGLQGLFPAGRHRPSVEPPTTVWCFLRARRDGTWGIPRRKRRPR
jgi:hypothetical protein